MPLAGFEEVTEDLNEYELSLVPVFVRGFATKTGKARAITNSSIVTIMNGKYHGKQKLSGPRVRKIINHIRNHNLVQGLIATSNGYYVSMDAEEVRKYISSLAGRENEIRRIKEGMIKYLNTIEPLG